MFTAQFALKLRRVVSGGDCFVGVRDSETLLVVTDKKLDGHRLTLSIRHDNGYYVIDDDGAAFAHLSHGLNDFSIDQCFEVLYLHAVREGMTVMNDARLQRAVPMGVPPQQFSDAHYRFLAEAVNSFTCRVSRVVMAPDIYAQRVHATSSKAYH